MIWICKQLINGSSLNSLFKIWTVQTFLDREIEYGEESGEREGWTLTCMWHQQRMFEQLCLPVLLHVV